MEIFVSKLPVFDWNKDAWGYELAFRSEFDKYYQSLNADTAAVDFMAFVNFGELSDGKNGFVNYSKDLLMKGFPVLLPKETMITGIPANIPADDSVVAACNKLKNHGYTLAVNNVTPQSLDNPLLEIADLVSVDFRYIESDQRQKICQQLRSSGIQLIAKNVDDEDTFDQAQQWGYSFFLGDFFTKPAPQTNGEIAPNKLAHLRLLAEIGKPTLSYDELAGVIQTDVALTFKLLRFMNSAWFGFSHEIKSIKHALVLLGPAEIRKWVSMATIQSLAADKPHELLLTSLTRAKVAEQLASRQSQSGPATEQFLLGMFSVIDALADVPMSTVLNDLPLAQSIKHALLEQPGKYRNILEMIKAYEAGDWEAFSVLASDLDVDEQEIPALFRSGRKWAHQALSEM